MKNSLLGTILVFLVLAGCSSDADDNKAPTTGNSVQGSSSDSKQTGHGGDCPSDSELASNTVMNAILAHQDCTKDDDCESVSFAASCFDSCERVMAKDGEADLAAARAQVDGNSCKSFLARGCHFDIPPCIAPAPTHCVANKCQ